jgi:hypothetical protein
MAIKTESRTALGELIQLLQEVDERWASEEWNLTGAEDISSAHRALMHMLEGGIATMFENDPKHPVFRRIVTPTRKFTGDNSDAIYYDAAVSPEHSYEVRGQMKGAVYVAITVEIGTEAGGMGSKTAGAINNTEFDVSSDGDFRIYLGGKKREHNWLPLSKGASRITTRHYFETMDSAAADPEQEPIMRIENLDPQSPPLYDDMTTATGIRRVAEFVRSRTLKQKPMSQSTPPAFLSLTPNAFPKPTPPGDMGLSAVDAHYSMAPFLLGPDEALVIRGRWPEDCVFANVCLWNRFQQTYDYRNRNISLNRTQTKLKIDGSFVMVLAHQDPGVPNWIDTEGNPFGMVFWRYFLAKSQPQTPEGQVVPYKDIGDI